MRVVEVADINKVFNMRKERLQKDPDAMQSELAGEVAKWGIELLEEIRKEILDYSSEEYRKE